MDICSYKVLTILSKTQHDLRLWYLWYQEFALSDPINQGQSTQKPIPWATMPYKMFGFD